MKSSSRSFRVLTALVMTASLLAFTQLLAASKKAAKSAEARVIYSGMFQGHVEPCG